MEFLIIIQYYVKAEVVPIIQYVDKLTRNAKKHDEIISIYERLNKCSKND